MRPPCAGAVIITLTLAVVLADTDNAGLGVCEDTHDSCAVWAKEGECEANPGFMLVGCAVSCQSCHLRDASVRCRREEGQTPVLQKAGDLDALLNRAVSDFAQFKPRVVHTDPKVIVFDEFLTPAEAAELAREAGHDFKPSREGGAHDGSGRLAELSGEGRRTSQSSNCVDGCDTSGIVRRVQQRVGNVTGVSLPNFEFIQAVKYEVGQLYVQHHDNNEQYFDMPMGARVLTFFMYLSPAPQAGGETQFPQLKVKVPPVPGRAVLWPNVYDEEPGRTDYRTTHEALPPTEGTKVGANFWIYNYDYRTPWKLACTG